MPPRRFDWDAVVEAWRVAKAKNPLLTQEQFYRDEGINAKTASRRIGRKLAETWRAIQAEAEKAANTRHGINLAEELVEVFRKGKKLYLFATDKLLPEVKKVDGKEELADPAVPLENAADATRLGALGQSAILDVTRLMSGGQPIMRPTGTVPTFRWNDPVKPKKTRRKP
ncbi:hypothetical protein LCGC14_0441160 [marine sediment metagenome]|uniref:Uncharacterized protein n=1 Tax=marine sediment metagenome TaxID=412755 RepID=A0A0F9SR72_9ZZZZ